MKTSLKYHGLDITEEAIERGRDSNGFYSRQTFKGTKAAIEAFEVSTLIAGGYSYSITGGPMWTARVNIDSSNNDPAEVVYPEFEVVDTSFTADTLDSINPLTEGLSVNTIRIVKKAIESGGGNGFLTDGTVPVAEVAAADLLYKLYTDGARDYYISNVSVRKSYTHSKAYVIADSVVGVNRIFTKSGLIGAESIPFALWALMPDSYSVTKSGRTWIAGYHYNMPTTTRVGPTLWRVQALYQFQLWPRDLYLDYFM